MTSIIAGGGLGLFGSSYTQVNGYGATGKAKIGQGNDGAYVNASTGNLVINAQDEFVSAYGLSDALTRTYNSLPNAEGYNLDQWQFSFERSLSVGVAPTTLHGNITRTTADGDVETFVYNAALQNGLGGWQSKNGSGTYDQIYAVTSSSISILAKLFGVVAVGGYVYNQGGTGITETYGSSGQLLTSRKLPGGGLLTYNYGTPLLDGTSKITSITDSSGQTVNLTYGTGLAANNLLSISVNAIVPGATSSTNTQALTRVEYGYDSLNRLTSVTTELTPNNSSSTFDSNVYTTQYTYGMIGTNLVTKIAQSDGTVANIAYQLVGTSYHVSSITDGLGNQTSFSYNLLSNTTTVTDPLKNVTTYSYDATTGHLLSVSQTDENSQPATTTYTYDSNNNITKVVDAAGRATYYTYDADGNNTEIQDSLGNTVTRTFDAADHLASQTVYTTAAPAVGQAASNPETTHYLYDGSENLVFTVSPLGEVTQYLYDSEGDRISAIRYPAVTYTGTTFTTAALSGWASSQDQTKIQRTDTGYDLTGQIQTVTVWNSTASGTGAGVNDGKQSVSHYVYDVHGRLLTSIDPRAASNVPTNTSADGQPLVTSYVYDGLNRVLSIQNGAQQLTTVNYNANVAVTTAPNGLTTTTTYNADGQAISTVEANSLGAPQIGANYYSYDADGHVASVTDGTGESTYYIYDAQGNRTGVISPQGELTETDYNDDGQPIATTQYATTIAPPPTPGYAIAQVRPATTSLDRTTRNFYDAAGRLIDVVDPLGYVTQYAYDGAGNKISSTQYSTALSSIPTSGNASDVHVPTSLADRTTRYFYDADNRLVGTLDAAGYLSQTVYDAAGEVIKTIAYATLTNPNLASSGTLAQLIPASDPVHDQATYRFYDAKGQLSSQIDADGYLTAYSYDAAGNQTQQIRYATAVSYNGSGAAPTPTTTTSDQKVSTQYDALNRVVQQTDAQGTITSYNYDPVSGFLTSVTTAASQTDALGRNDARTVSYQYDALGRVLNTISGNGNAAIAAGASANTVASSYGTHRTYDLAGRLASSTDADGHTQYYYYDGDGRLRYTVNGAGEVSESQYDAFGDVVKTVQYHQRISTSGLAGGLVSNDSAFSSQINASSEQSDSSNRVTTSVYSDNRGLLTESTDALGFSTNYDYDSFGDLTSTSKSIGRTPNTQFETDQSTYDARGERISTTYDVGTSNYLDQLSYDAFGRLVQTIDPNGNITSTQYDQLGRTVTVTDALGQNTLATYDAFGRVLTQTDRTGDVTRYAYNDATQSMTVTTQDGYVTTTQTNRHGQTIGIIDANGTVTTYAYDADGNLRTTVEDTGNGHLNLTSSNAYDNADLLSSSTDAAGVVTSYSYDAANRVWTRTVDPSGLNLQTVYAYDAFGGAIRVTDPTGTVTETVFDNKGEAIHVITDTSGLKLATSYTYDSAGKTLTVLEGQQATGSAGTGANTGSWTFGSALKATQYTYDDLDRLHMKVVDPDLTPSSNPSQDTNPTTGQPYLNLTTTYAYDGDNNLISKTDPNGNTSRYVYDADNRQVFSVDATGAVSQNVYDPEGRVVRTLQYANPIALSSNTDAMTVRNLVATANGGSTYEGPAAYFYFNSTQVAGTTALYRFENTTSGDTILTTDPTQANSPNTAGYQNDGIAGYIYSTQVAGTVPLYAMSYAGHFYTANAAERTAVLSYGGTDQGIVGYVFASQVSGTVPLYRLRTPSGGHTYTPSIIERDTSLGTVATERQTYSIYDGDGRLAYSIDAQGGVTGYSYDNDGRVVDTAHYAVPLTASQIQNLPASPAPSTIQGLLTTSSADQHTRTAYDAAGRAVFQVDALNYLTQNSYDSDGRVIQTRRFSTPLPAGTPITQTGINTQLSSSSSISNSALDEITQTVYDTAGRAVYQVDALNHLTQNTYDGDGRLIQTRQYNAPLPAGTPITKAGIDGQLASNTSIKDDTNDRVVRYVYDTAGRQRFVLHTISHSNANGGSQDTVYVTETRYNAIGWVTDTDTYANSITIDATSPPIATAVASAAMAVANSSLDEHDSNTYDAAGRLLVATDAVGSTELYTYDANGNKKTYTNKNGFVWSYVYDADNRLTLEVDPTAPVYTMSGVGTPVSTTLADEQLASGITYDAFGDVTSRSDGIATASGASFSFAASRSTNYSYDALGRQVQTASPSFQVYNSASDSSSGFAANRGIFENALTPTSTLYLDALGNQIAGQDAAGNYSYKLYDNLGRVAYEVDTDRDVTAYTYDAFGNVTALTRYATTISDSDTTTGSTSSLHQLEGVITAAAPGSTAARDAAIAASAKVSALVSALSTAGSRTITTTYDQLNRKTKVQLPSADTYTTTAASAGGTTSIGSPTTNYSYDSFGDVIAQGQLLNASTGANATTFSKYDRLGRLTDQIDPLGYYTLNTYDAFSRLTDTIQYANPLSTVPTNNPTFVPPPASAANAAVYSANTSATTGFSSAGYDRNVAYVYDQLNRKVQQTRVGVLSSSLDSSENLSYSVGNLTTTTWYDKVGNVVQVMDEQGNLTTWYHDSLGQVFGIKQAARTVLVNGSSQSVAPVTGYAYDQFGNQVETLRYGENLTTAPADDSLPPIQNSAVDQQSFTRYDYDGHAIETIDALGNITDNSYDALGHVVRTWSTQTDVAGDAAQTKVELFQYDKTGRQTATVEVVRDPTKGSAYNDLVDTAVAYDAFGEVTLKAVGHLATGDAAATLDGSEYSDYDADGRVWQTDKDGVDTVYRYDLNGDVTSKVVLPGTAQAANTSPTAARLSAPSAIASILANGVAGTNFIETDYVYDALGRVLQERDPSFTQTPVSATSGGVLTLGEVNTITNPNSPKTWTSTTSSKTVTVNEDPETTYSLVNTISLSWPTIAAYGSNPIQIVINYTLTNGTAGQYVYTTTASAAATGTPQTIAWGSTGLMLRPPTIQTITGVYVKLQAANGTSQAIRSTDVSGPSLEIFAPSFITPGTFSYQPANGSSATVGVTPTAATVGSANYIIPIAAGSLAPSTTYNYSFGTQESQSNFPGEPGTAYYGTFTTDANGNIATFASSGTANTTSPVHTQTLDRWGNVITSVDARNSAWVTKNFYDDRNDLIETVAPTVTAWNSSNTQSETDTPTTKSFYNAIGQKIASSDADGNVTRDVLDAAGNELEERRPDGGDLKNAYDVLGRKVQSVDGDGNVTTYTYDKNNELLSQDLSGFGAGLDQITTYTYDQSGNRTSSSDALGDITRSVYDTRGLLVESLSPLSEYTTVGADAAYVTHYSYDALGNKIGVINDLATHASESWSYDYFGRLIGHTDLAGSSYAYTYDGFGRLVNQTSSLPGSSYDGSNISDWQQQIYGGQSGYDNGSWSVSSAYGNPSPSFYGYAVRSNADLLSHNFNLNESSSFSVGFDTAITLNQTNSEAQYYFLSNGNVGPSIYVDYNGNIVYNDGAGNTQSYTGFPNNTAVHFAITATETAAGKYAISVTITRKDTGASVASFTANATASGGQVGFASVNATGQTNAHALYVDNITVNGGASSTYQNLTYTYNANGSLFTITDNQAGADQRVTTYRYDANGNQIGERNTDTVTHTDYENNVISYDALNRLDRVRDSQYVLTYGYDDSGNRIRIYTQYYASASQASATTQDYWYTYDAENRITLAEGQSSGSSIVQGVNGTTLFYDLAGNRVKALSYTYAATETDYSYTADHQLAQTSITRTLSTTVTEGGIADKRSYDRAGREIEDDDYGLVDNETSTSIMRQQMTYNANSELLTENSSTSPTGSNTWTPNSEISYTSTPTESASAAQSDAGYYDGLGNASQYNVHVDSGNGNYSYLSTFSPTGDTEQRSVERVNSAGLISGVTTYVYDPEGNNIQINNPSNTTGVTQQNLIYDSQGHILQQNQTNAGTPQSQSYFYADGNPIGSVGNIDASTFDYNYTPISSTYPPSNPGSYIASGGETLNDVAQAEYGDSTLWYLIADANGLSGGTPLTAGQVLIIPNQVTNVHNTATTFKPYDPNQIIGTNTPQLTAPPPPKQSSSGLSTLLTVVVAAIAAVAAAYGQFYVGPALASDIGAGAATTAVISGATAGALGSAAGQLAGDVVGTSHGFSLSELGEATLAGGVTGGIGNQLDITPGTAATDFPQGAAEGALDSVAIQGVGLALGTQKSFSWSSVAAQSIVDGAFSEFNRPGGNNFDSSISTNNLQVGGISIGRIAGQTIDGFAAGVATQEIRALLGVNGKIDFANIAADSFGNALGNSIAGAIQTTNAEQQQRDAETRVEAARETAGLADDGVSSSASTDSTGVSAGVQGSGGSSNRVYISASEYDQLTQQLGVGGLGVAQLEKLGIFLKPEDDGGIQTNINVPHSVYSGSASGPSAPSAAPSFFSVASNVVNGAVHGFNSVTQRAGSYVADQAFAFAHGDFQGSALGQAYSAAKQAYGTAEQFASDELSREADGGFGNTVTGQLLDSASNVTAAQVYEGAFDETSRAIGGVADYYSSHSADQIGYDVGNFAGEAAPGIILTAGAGTAIELGGEAVAAVGSALADAGEVAAVEGGVLATEASAEGAAAVETIAVGQVEAEQVLTSSADQASALAESGSPEGAVAAQAIEDAAPETAAAKVANADSSAATLDGEAVSSAGGADTLESEAAVGPEATNSANATYLTRANINELSPGFYRANPLDIGFSQSDASPFFRDGTPVGKTIDALRSGAITPDEVGAPIRVVNVEGKPFSIDNRRLAAFSMSGQADIPIQLVSLDEDPELAQLFYDRFDPINGEGSTIAFATRAQRTSTQQLLKDLGMINGIQLGQ